MQSVVQTSAQVDAHVLAEYEEPYRAANRLQVWGMVLLVVSLLTAPVGAVMIGCAITRKNAIKDQVTETGRDPIAWARAFDKEAWRMGFLIFGTWFAVNFLGIMALITSHSIHR